MPVNTPAPGSQPEAAYLATKAPDGTPLPVCALDIGPTLPSYCDYVPFATTLFSECALPTAADLAKIGSYTVYQTAQLPTAAYTTPEGGPTGQTGSGVDVATQMAAQNVENAQQVYDTQRGMTPSGKQDTCSYDAAQNHPVLSQIFGTTATCALTDPFNPSSLFPGWILYAGLAVVGLIALSLVVPRR